MVYTKVYMPLKTGSKTGLEMNWMQINHNPWTQILKKRRNVRTALNARCAAKTAAVSAGEEGIAGEPVSWVPVLLTGNIWSGRGRCGLTRIDGMSPGKGE